MPEGMLSKPGGLRAGLPRPEFTHPMANHRPSQNIIDRRRADYSTAAVPLLGYQAMFHELRTRLRPPQVQGPFAADVARALARPE
jgi:hypothetical protein